MPDQNNLNLPQAFPEDTNIPPIFSPTQIINDSAPPTIPPDKPKKKFGGKKVIATILGLLILLGSLGAGIILVKQQQDIREKASGSPPCKVCDKYAVCVENPRPCISTLNECGAGKPICAKPPTAPPPPATLCPKDCLPQSQCKAGTQVGGVGYGDCGMGEYCCDKKDETPTLCPYDCVSQSQCKAGGKNLGLGYGDCGAAAGEYCCETSEAPPPTACTGTDSCIIPDHENTACEQVNGQWQRCTHYVGDNGYKCDLCKGVKAGDTKGQCAVANHYCIPGGYCITNATCEYRATSCTPDPSCATSPPDDDRAACLNIKAYDTNWNQLSQVQLNALKSGDEVRFTVAGTPANKIDKAKFKINGVDRPETSAKKPGTDEYYDEYTIPAGTTSFTVNAKLRHVTLGWF